MGGGVSFTTKYQCVEINQFVAATKDAEFRDQKCATKDARNRQLILILKRTILMYRPL